MQGTLSDAEKALASNGLDLKSVQAAAQPAAEAAQQVWHLHILASLSRHVQTGKILAEGLPSNYTTLYTAGMI